MKFEVTRYEYYDDRTIGRLEIDGKFFCWTLEDKVRPDGVKIYGETAIPEGDYIVTIKAFRGDEGKMYPYLHDVPMFEGICMHGGNKPEDTLGCILVAFKRDDTDKDHPTIHESAILKLVEHMKDNLGPLKLIVKNGG